MIINPIRIKTYHWKRSTSPINKFLTISIITILILIFFNSKFLNSQEYIMSDYDYTNQEYTFQQVWKFVKSYKNTALNYDDVETLVRYCHYFVISPIYALARMQFESDLLVRSTPKVSEKYLKHRAMAYGMYIHVRRDGLKMYKYGGYDIQVYKGIQLMRQAFDRWDETKIIYVKDLKRKIKPINAATYVLYYYTPFYGRHNIYNWENDAIGVKAFEKLIPDLKKRWNKLFKKK